jgi:thioredoxin reductase (NADPH)
MASADDGSGGHRVGGLDQVGGRSGDYLLIEPGRSPVLDEAQLDLLRAYGTERDVAAGDVLFAAGDAIYDLIVMLHGTAEIVGAYGRPEGRIIATYGPSQFLGEIGMLTGQRAFLSAVATSPGRVLVVPARQVRVVIAEEPSSATSFCERSCSGIRT